MTKLSVLDLLYKEAIRMKKYENFITCLKSPISDDGCGLKFVARAIEEHYKKESTRFNKLTSRLIGAQAIALAKYSYRLVDNIIPCGGEESVLVKVIRNKPS